MAKVVEIQLEKLVMSITYCPSSCFFFLLQDVSILNTPDFYALYKTKIKRVMYWD